MTRSRFSLTACVGVAACSRRRGTARPRDARTATHAQAVVKLGFITKFPVDFYTTLVRRGEEVGQGDARREGHLRAGQERRPTTRVRSPRSRTWSPRA